MLILYEEDQDGFRECRRSVMSSEMTSTSSLITLVLWYRYGWQDGLFDVTWSEVNEAVLVAAGGDGNVLIFDQGVTQVK